MGTADQLRTKEEALDRLRVSMPTLDRMIARGELPVVRVSERCVRVTESAIRDFIKQRTERRGR